MSIFNHVLMLIRVGVFFISFSFLGLSDEAYFGCTYVLTTGLIGAL